ncbi:hypothetical protein [Myxococcus faecalis]|uniref:hypothetical protein n=1 Tax=Myxococcus faecalis TaxID=3115646 RepID=UPI003CF791FB
MRAVEDEPTGAPSTVKRTTWKSSGDSVPDVQSPLVTRRMCGIPSMRFAPETGCS